ncbi:hypothetical protein XENTR_v10007298 [Xenopus tropicalis]|nr:hypothetical protein XENTR_v10007298 [Xenopus tropicalis]
MKVEIQRKTFISGDFSLFALCRMFILCSYFISPFNIYIYIKHSQKPSRDSTLFGQTTAPVLSMLQTTLIPKLPRLMYLSSEKPIAFVSLYKMNNKVAKFHLPKHCPVRGRTIKLGKCKIHLFPFSPSSAGQPWAVQG